MRLRTVFAVVLAVAVSGCTAFTDPSRLPIVRRDVAGEADVLATKAERRIIFVSGDGKTVCVEPSPDVSEAVATAVHAMVNGTASKDDAVGSAGFTLSRGMANSIAMLFVRTQGIQFFRDGSFALCQAYTSHAIDEKAYLDRLDRFRADARALIEKELDGINTLRSSLVVRNVAPEPPRPAGAGPSGDGAEAGKPAAQSDPKKP
ncbi:MAG: hypothetical protein AB9900_00620 [Humidesulfovibrio sp.]